jgi:regulation of enolase protein 1 (concanavalin A-like superfamily)
MRDDGAVVYLNGTEVFRSNMPSGQITSQTFASSTVSDADETAWFPANIPPSALRTGNNIIAVEVHQVSPDSSDLTFDLQLAATLKQPSPPPPPPPVVGQLPAPWADRDIGAVGVAGSATFANGTYTVKGAGADIWNNADQLQFVYQPLTGDGTIVARVASQQASDLLAKAGIDVRDTLDAGAKHAGLYLTPGNGVRFIRRGSTSGGSTSSVTTDNSNVKAPVWLKLVRSGSTITAYRSADGSAWTLIGSDTISMNQTVYVGLAVSSHQTSVLSTATFDNVSVTTP